ncbi:MAG: tripartite tricarboxylate transporter substrate-binding protein [Reyranellaceae bacterium]
MDFTSAGNALRLLALSGRTAAGRLARSWRDSGPGTPRPIVDKLNRELNAVVSSPAYRKRVSELGAVAGEPMTPEAFRTLYRAEADQWGALIRRIGLKLD